MLKYVFSFILHVILFAVLISGNSYADRRHFVWNYEYQILAKGESELENYMTITTPTGNLKGNATTTLQMEYEVGMTEHFDFAIYQIFKQSPAQSLMYDGFKLRARYKFGEKGDFFLDPLIYLEYVGKPDFQEHEVELKLILSKDIGKFNFVINPVLEFEKTTGSWESVFGYTLGARYTVSDLVSVGLEALGDDHGNYFGPTISHGGHKAWFSLGALFNAGTITDNAPKFQLRFLTGFEL